MAFVSLLLVVAGIAVASAWSQHVKKENAKEMARIEALISDFEND